MFPGAGIVEATKRFYNWVQNPARIDALSNFEQLIDRPFWVVVNGTVKQVLQEDTGLGGRSVFERLSIQLVEADLYRMIDPIVKGELNDMVILDGESGYQYGLYDHEVEQWRLCNDGRPEGRQVANWLPRCHYINAQTQLFNTIEKVQNPIRRRGLQRDLNTFTQAFVQERTGPA